MKKMWLALIAIGWLLSMDYLHMDAQPDAIICSIKYEILKNVFVGAGYAVLVQPNIFVPRPQYIVNNQSIMLGISVKL